LNKNGRNQFGKLVLPATTSVTALMCKPVLLTAGPLRMSLLAVGFFRASLLNTDLLRTSLLPRGSRDSLRRSLLLIICPGLWLTRWRLDNPGFLLSR
jgi:hypothetical protein